MRASEACEFWAGTRNLKEKTVPAPFASHREKPRATPRTNRANLVGDGGLLDRCYSSQWQTGPRPTSRARPRARSSRPVHQEFIAGACPSAPQSGQCSAKHVMIEAERRSNRGPRSSDSHTFGNKTGTPPILAPGRTCLAMKSQTAPSHVVQFARRKEARQLDPRVFITVGGMHHVDCDISAEITADSAFGSLARVGRA